MGLGESPTNQRSSGDSLNFTAARVSDKPGRSKERDQRPEPFN
jgi:hypothetical protein